MIQKVNTPTAPAQHAAIMEKAQELGPRDTGLGMRERRLLGLSNQRIRKVPWSL